MLVPLLGSRTHWVRQLPGQLFHNIISHGIAKLVEFLRGRPRGGHCHSQHQSNQLRSLGAQQVPGRVEGHDSGHEWHHGVLLFFDPSQGA